MIWFWQHFQVVPELPRCCESHQLTSMEDILLRSTHLPSSFTRGSLQPCCFSKHTTDKIKKNDRIAVHTDGDGNCMYNAISIAMYGSPAFAMQVKLRTAIAMGTRAPEIKALHQQHGFIHVCFEYELAVLSACKNKEYSCGWNMIAAAVALDQPIASVFPKMNGRCVQNTEYNK